MRSSKAIVNQLRLMRVMRSEQGSGNGNLQTAYVTRNGNLLPVGMDNAVIAEMRRQDPEAGEQEFWNPPIPHGGERNVASKSSATKVGVIVSNNREVPVESSYEERAFYVVQARPGFMSLRSQYPMATYVDDNGAEHKHFFDALAEFADGQRVAIAVKPERSRGKIEPILEKIKKRGSPHFDAVELITEKTATVEEYQNATELLLNRKLHNQTDVDRLIADLREGPACASFLRMLYSDVPLPDRRVAIWRLIDLGILSRIGSGRISYDTQFTVRL